MLYFAKMRIPSDTHEKMMSAYQLLGQDIISIGAFEHVRVLLKGVHPKIDEKLEICSRAFATIQKIQSGDIATLSAESLPEQSEKQKKRKKAILFFVSSLKDLQSEIKRVDVEILQMHQSKDSLWHAGKIIKFAKGPFGLVTIIALVIVVVLLLSHKQNNGVSNVKPTISPTKAMIQAIVFNNKKIPLSQLFIGHGTDCDSAHYHAIGEIKVTALDGTVLPDPGGCGFGRVKDVQVITVLQ